MQELDALFVEFDRDGNGQLDRTELEALILHIFGGADAVDAAEQCGLDIASVPHLTRELH